MSKDKTLEIKESRVRELAEECADYKKAMQILFPEVMENEPKGNITNKVQVETMRSQGNNNMPDMRIYLTHEGSVIGDVHNTGIVINKNGYEKKVEETFENYFQIYKK